VPGPRGTDPGPERRSDPLGTPELSVVVIGYNDRANLTQAISSVLTQTLRHLERDGVVRRDVVATVPVTVTYTLTPLGRSLGAAVATMRAWAYQHMDDIVAARNEYDARD